MEVGAVAAMRYVTDGIKADRLVMQHTLLVGENASEFAISMGLPGPTNLRLPHVGLHSHDTISMAVIDRMGHIAVGTSTNGATFKIPSRVGDGPIAGSSAYVVDEVGACCATGDGDIMMRFLPCYQVVESMRLGMEPKLAATAPLQNIYLACYCTDISMNQLSV
ncbi:N-terminal nucleophile aminohydrolase (Ntn hydrolase) superfamily protein [Trifolium repens]|nr:N-terminal nucleophile aminohydrolase (Ntn hydrolase) superfamily protein [Trifolium repens]